MTLKFMIIAEVSGITALTTFELEDLKWIPVDAPGHLSAELPDRIYEINICNDREVVRQSGMQGHILRERYSG